MVTVYLYPRFYDRSCPKAKEIVNSVVAKAVAREPRMAASLLRLHFHDCFVKGCDASILLDCSGSMITEKRSKPNRKLVGSKSLTRSNLPWRRTALTLSCADIMALAARDSTVLVWQALLAVRHWYCLLQKTLRLGLSLLLCGEKVVELVRLDLLELNFYRYLNIFRNVTHCTSKWAKARHTWALFNTTVMSQYTVRGFSAPDKFIVAAVTGYFHSIACAANAKGVDDSLQVNHIP
ncbi:Peroxidase [Actinidia chinensis var. chinensis]|uniref:peroxidase n=1 Tax=Actinidia chinensis var. chinensis TaxID=1590841 RepID=A0A2R6RYV0_ACTCC|nr:Peroxidase [Actinidia chinensis var. chinensis]